MEEDASEYEYEDDEFEEHDEGFVSTNIYLHFSSLREATFLWN